MCCARPLDRAEREGDAGQGMYRDTPETPGRESEDLITEAETEGEGAVVQAAVSLAMSALLFQPIAEQGMYSMDASGKLSKGSFNNLEVPAMGERKTVPTIEAFFPFSK